MEITAQLNGIRLAPRKVRAVARLLRRKGAPEALNQLEHTVKRSAPALAKLVASAIANAEHAYRMVRDNLYIKDIAVDEGMKLKRFMPKGFGRAAVINKRTSRITVVLAERVPGLKRTEAEAKPEPEAAAPEHQEQKAMPDDGGKKPEVKRELGAKQGFLGRMGRKLFRRKSV